MLRRAAASFLGSHTNRVDAKGRMAAPADFRKSLDLKTFNGFFCVPSLEGPVLDCGGLDYIERLKASISALDPFDPDRRALEIALLGQARPITFGGEGRFILPKPLRAHAMIEEEAFFIGLGDTFQIWRSTGAEAEVGDHAGRARAALSRLKNPAPAAGAPVEGGAL